MTALAAAPLGIEVHIYDPASDCPASAVTPHHHQGTYDDKMALTAFANAVDSITYEFENIPLETVTFLQNIKPVFPKPSLLGVAQHRGTEKDFLNKAGLKTANYRVANTADDIHATMNDWGASSCIIKTTRMGYDGKGQAFIRDHDAVDAAVKAMNNAEFIIESVVDFDCEISVIVCRDQHGHCDAYAPGLNEHRNHILYQTTIPAPLPHGLLEQARQSAITLAEALDLVGVLGLELFVTKDHELLANEIAPRPHNSGHWTQDACATSQFEQHARATAGMPLGRCDRHHDATMTNLLGDAITSITDQPNQHIHLYGKAAAKPGRKMGHINQLKTMKDKT